MPSPDPAASVLLLRDSGHGFQVLMVERNARGFFADLLVFPGGGVDECDVPEGRGRWDEISHRRAAVRELAEETGILISGGTSRVAPLAKGPGFYQEVEEHEMEVATGALTLVSRWVTPELAPRRFDTRFYLATCGDSPRVTLDTEELVAYDWVDPADSVSRYEAGEMNLILPTLAHLRWLSRRSSIEDALESASGADGRTLIRPERMEDGSILPVHLPAEVI
ncbi:MAG TPA: NUDIX hydrolase [Acidimicrobiia bacterium]